MSSMIKKKGALSFKPKAPQARRPGAPPSTAAPSTRQSVDRQSQTPVPSLRSVAAVSPPVESLSSQNTQVAPQVQTHSAAATTPFVSKSLDQPSVETLDQGIIHPAVQAISILASTSRELEIPTSNEKGSDQSTVAPRHAYPEDRQEDRQSTPSNSIQDAVSREWETTGGFHEHHTQIQDDMPSIAAIIVAPHESSAGESTTQALQTSIPTSLPNPQSTADRTQRPTAIDAQPPDDIDIRHKDIPGASSTSGDVSQSETIDLSTMGAGESLRRSQLVLMAQLNPDGTSGAVITPTPIHKLKKPSKRRRIDGEEIDIRPTIEVQVNRASLPGHVKKPRKPRDKNAEGARKRRKREETPDDAEEREIDTSTVKMAELCNDPRIGKKFSKHAEIKQRDLEKKIRAKLARDHPELLQEEENQNTPSRDNGREDTLIDPVGGPQMRVLDGQIVIDERSLVVDRHKRAAAAQSVMEEIEENEFTRITTSGTLMKREKNVYWDHVSNEKFYDGLRMFGTDFEMISNMFPNRNRRQIKLKFNKEEKAFPKKIASALMGEKVEIDLEEYKLHTGLEYEEVAEINAEQATIEAEHVAEQTRQQEHADLTDRQKKAAIHKDGPMAGTDSAKENEGASGLSQGRKASAASKSKKMAGKRRKNLHSTKGGGEEVEVLGRIDA